MTSAIRHQVAELDQDQPISDIRTMDEVVAQAQAGHRFPMVMMGVFAGLALALAAVGIYGVMSYSVAQRVHEIGIRMALGAGRRDVLGTVMGDGMRLAVAGVAVGLLGGLAMTRGMSGLLYGVRPADPLTFVAVSLTLVSVAVVASYIPARRAAKVDPMVSLRHE